MSPRDAWQHESQSDEVRVERLSRRDGSFYLRFTTPENYGSVLRYVERLGSQQYGALGVVCWFAPDQRNQDRAALAYAGMVLQMLAAGAVVDAATLSAVTAVNGIDKLRALRAAEKAERSRPDGGRPLVLGAIGVRRSIVLDARE